MSLILDLAVRDGRLHRNVAARVPLPRLHRPQKRFLTHGQVIALADASGRYRLVVELLALTGLRFGELAALKVGRVDMLRRRLAVVESVSEVAGDMIFTDPKTHQLRSVPFPKALAEPLAALVAAKGPEHLVFTSPRGGVLRLSTFRRRYFDPAATQVGLEGLTPHELRHTAASLAISAGANVKAVQLMLGHASASMTLDVYSGLFEDDLDALAERLDGAAASARVPRVCPTPVVADLDSRRSGL